MARDGRNPFEKHLVGLWQYDTSVPKHPEPLVDGSANETRTKVSCVSDKLGVPGIEGAFDLTEGSLVLNFALDLWADEAEDDFGNCNQQDAEDGAFEIRVTQDHRVEVLHTVLGHQFVLQTAPWMIADGDDVEVTFSWTDGISCTLKVKNLTDGTDDIANTLVTDRDLIDAKMQDCDFKSGAQASYGAVTSASFNGVISSVAVYNCDILREEYLRALENGPKLNERPRLTLLSGGGHTQGTTAPIGSLSVVYDADKPDTGVVQFFDDSGAPAGSRDFRDNADAIPCFTPGTFIATPRGERRVETLQVGDRVITRDNGIQTIRWVGHRKMTRADLLRAAHLKPVLISKGVLGDDLPERDMLVSPNHRLMVANDQSVLHFEKSEVLVAAKHLTGLTGIDTIDVTETTYIHLMFDQHEVILSDGLWTECFQPSDLSLGGTDNSQRSEIFELFPELSTYDGLKIYQSARQNPKKHERRALK